MRTRITGRALDVGAGEGGEGGDAVWLAEQGWPVTANDISRRALDRVALLDAVAPGGTLLVVSHDIEPMRRPIDTHQHSQAFPDRSAVRSFHVRGSPLRDPSAQHRSADVVWADVTGPVGRPTSGCDPGQCSTGSGDAGR